MKTEILSLIIALMVLPSFAIKAQLVSVAGMILDVNTRVNIPQLSVVDQKSGIGTISSENGSFLLYLKPGEVVLNFSDEKYHSMTTTIQLTRDTTLQVFLSALSTDDIKKGKKEHQKGVGQQAYMEQPGPAKK